MASADSEPHRQLVERGHFLEAEHLECISMQRLAFERALDKSPGESLAYPHWLRVVEVPPSSTGRALFHDGENPFPFIGVGSDILRKSEVTGVVQPAKDNEGTHLELASDA